jgi:hypothetical protein
MKKISRKKGPVVAKKVIYDGVTFASGLEKYMYKALKDANIDFEYEGRTFELLPSFTFENISIEKQSNGKGDFINRGNKKVLNLKYTPDFIGKDFIIETKGRANESFPLRWKLFKKWMMDNNDTRTLYKPQKQSECDITIELILKTKTNDKKETEVSRNARRTK